jgi:thymidine kinase
MSGYLELFIGPINSPKTFRLEQLYDQYKTIHSSIVIINKLSSCNGYNNCKKYCIIKTDNLLDLWREHISLEDDLAISEKDRNIFKIATSNVIFIDEGHLFHDLKEFIEFLLKHDKRVYIFGLDGDFERKKIGNILDLIPMCDKVSKLTSFCQICKDGTQGIFTKRLKKNIFCCDYTDIAVCRKCY